MEFAVALMLILSETLNLAGMVRKTGGARARARRRRTHAHPHSHHDYVHEHPHGHEPGAHGPRASQTPLARLDAMFGRLGGYASPGPSSWVSVHGSRASAAVALLVLAKIRDPRWRSPTSCSSAPDHRRDDARHRGDQPPFAYAEGRFVRAHRHLRVATSLLSIASGVPGVRDRIVDGLLGANPRWSPK